MATGASKLVLSFVAGPLVGRRLEITSDVVVGRERADVNIEDRQVSRKHAIVRRTNGGFEIEDTNSLNGTVVNDVPIRARTPLRNGDIIEIGASRIEVVLEAQVPSEFRTSDVRSGSDLVGTTLGQYELVEILSGDEMFTIYKGWQESLDRYVAVKVLAHPQEEQFAARFKLEARILARLQHPNIIPIYDNGEKSGLLYLVMQYIDSEVLLSEMVGDAMEPTRALRVGSPSGGLPPGQFSPTGPRSRHHRRGRSTRVCPPTSSRCCREPWPRRRRSAIRARPRWAGRSSGSPTPWSVLGSPTRSRSSIRRACAPSSKVGGSSRSSDWTAWWRWTPITRTPPCCSRWPLPKGAASSGRAGSPGFLGGAFLVQNASLRFLGSLAGSNVHGTLLRAEFVRRRARLSRPGWRARPRPARAPSAIP